MKFKKKILCLLSLFLIYKVFIYNDDFFVERFNEVKDYVIEQASIMINGHDLIDEYDSSDVESSFLKNKDNYTPNDDAENKVFNSISEASSYLRKQMVNRKNNITVRINRKFYNDMPKDVFNKAVSVYPGNVSSEGDYLANNLKGYNCQAEYSLYKNSTTLKYNVSYLTTETEEDEVNYKVKLVLDKLNVYDKDDYTKVKAVHDYIVKNIKYDHSLQNYSAYDAIINKNVVCQGYATLTYKMLTELGVDCRYISGTSNEGPHAWNIVKIGDVWYNLDNTWDASYTRGPFLSYKHFLKSNNDFTNHIRSDEFNTSSFNSEYPMSQTSYTK